MTAAEKEQRWMAAWRIAGPELAAIRAAELAAMTDDDVRAAIRAVMSLSGQAYRRPEDWTTSGLVEQQRLFSHARIQRRS